MIRFTQSQMWRLIEELGAISDEIGHDADGHLQEIGAFIRLNTVEVSATTQKLIDMLIQRDQMGRTKYGTTLDRTDLTLDQWLQHQVEELLDGAGYALAAMRTNQAPVPETPGCAHDWLYYRGYSDGELYTGRHCRNCAEEWRDGVKVTPDAAEFNRDGD